MRSKSQATPTEASEAEPHGRLLPPISDAKIAAPALALSLSGGGGDDLGRKRAEKIVDALQGKRLLVPCLFSYLCFFKLILVSPHRKQTPYMRVTLSQHELPHLVQKGATYVNFFASFSH